jgi:hypothetical protein
MARSSYVYLVDRCHTIVGAFTVKHEMVSAVKRQIEANGLQWMMGVRFRRARDGVVEEVKNVSEDFPELYGLPPHQAG